MHGADCDYSFERGYPPVCNHPEETSFLAKIAKQTEGVEKVEESGMQMGGEDFASTCSTSKGHFSSQAPVLKIRRRCFPSPSEV